MKLTPTHLQVSFQFLDLQLQFAGCSLCYLSQGPLGTKLTLHYVHCRSNLIVERGRKLQLHVAFLLLCKLMCHTHVFPCTLFAHTHPKIHTYIYMYTHMHTLIHSCKHTDTHMHTHSLSHTHIHTHTHMHTSMHTQAAHTRMHTHTHACTHTHTHTHSFTTLSFVVSCVFPVATVAAV